MPQAWVVPESHDGILENEGAALNIHYIDQIDDAPSETRRNLFVGKFHSIDSACLFTFGRETQ